MKILNINVLRGPNYWSNYRKKLIAIKLDLEHFEELPTNLLNNFTSRLHQLIPSISSHYCSRGVEGGFIQRLTEGTWLGHVIEHIALELQYLAGMDCHFGRTFSAKEHGVYYVIFAYDIEEAGLYAGHAAIKLVESLAYEKDYPHLMTDIAHLKKIIAREKWGPSTTSIIKEAAKRDIPYAKINDTSIFMLGHGCNQRLIWATVSSHTSAIGMDIAADKEITKQILAANFIPVPKGLTVDSLDELDNAINELGFPLVIKPKDGNHGKGITTNINHKEKAIYGFNLAQKISQQVIAERFIVGSDYRFLVINYKVAAVAKRTPAMVIGNGLHSIQELIDETNRDAKRGQAHENVLTSIKIDDTTFAILNEKKLSLNTKLPKGQVLHLKDAANISSGGTAADVTHEVHPYNIALAERIARLINLDICGIDIIAKNIKEPVIEGNGCVLEVNAGPGFRMHLSPSQGAARNVAAPVVDMLYPPGQPSRIPLIAVTGTNGKTTVVRLLAHVAKSAKYYVGYTTTEGIYIDSHLIQAGDCSGPLSAQVVLRDPLVNFAVLECARGGIIRSGLGFDKCSISIITNITNDHLGLNDIHTLEELADVKAVVAKSTDKNGYAILNAEDDLVYAIKKELSCHIALFSLEKNSRITMHCDNGGLAAYIDNNHVIIQKGNEQISLMKVSSIPITFFGTASCMVQNILPTILACFISGFELETIKNALTAFNPTAELLPGRMNIFDFDDFNIMLDYAHNEGAYIHLKNYIDKIACKKKIGIIGATGDRRPEDIQKIGYYAAFMFDEIIIRHDKEGRGRTNEQLTDLIMQGISQAKIKANVKIISQELEALRYAIDTAVQDTFIFYSPDDVFCAIEYLKQEKQVRRYALSNELEKDYLYDGKG